MNHETRREIIDNAITPPQKIKEQELHFGMQDEEMLELLKTRHVLSTMFIF